MSACVAATVAALALMIAPAGAQGASPVLEFSSPGNSFPIEFEAVGGAVNARLGDFNRVVECSGSEGAGEVTGPRTTLSAYAFTGCVAETIPPSGSPLDCESEEAEPNEIWSELIEAEPVYLNQASHEVAILLDPHGQGYMEFECGANTIQAFGPFLAPVTPVNQLASSFTATLKRNGNSQIPTQYEDLDGVKHQAIPTAVVNGGATDNSGVGLAFTIQTEVPLEIKATSREEIEAKQRAEDEAAAKKKQDEDAAKAAADKKRQEEQAAKDAAAKKLQEEQAAANKHEKELRQKQRQAKKRAQQRTKALKQCRKLKTSQKRSRCETRVKKKFSAPKKAHSMRIARF